MPSPFDKLRAGSDGLGILSFPFPGTAVPGYRLFRPYGTGLAQPGWTSCHSTAG